jgi:hypothetical protein
VSEVNERSLLLDAEESWARLAADVAAFAVYRAETNELQVFDAKLPDD